MRLTTKSWSISGKSQLGWNHERTTKNNQDAYSFGSIQDKDIVFGFVSDGCSLGEHSEVGSKTLVEFAKTQTLHLLSLENSTEQIINKLFADIRLFIRNQVLQIVGEDEIRQAEFLFHYYCATLIGVIIKETDESIGNIFYAGDGVTFPGPSGDLFKIDQQNKPHYMAYAALDHPEKFKVPIDVIPQNFIRYSIPKNTDKIMIATDGFEDHSKRKIDANAKINGVTRPYSLHGLQWEKKGHYGLHRWINTMSEYGYFNDDATLITIERNTNEQDNSNR